VLPAIILSAGASSRMGRVKALLPTPGGASFLATLARTMARAGANPVVAVVGSHGEEIRAHVARESIAVEIVENPDPSRGQLSSLVAALEALAPREPEAVLVVPVDQPLVSAVTVRAVVAVWRRTGAPVVRPSRGGRHGHPVLFSTSVFPELRAADLSLGARPVVRAHAADLVDVPSDDPGAFEDIDTPGDYRRVFGVELE
jgi:molybdenum cofactor cytidylyltransferase